MERNKPRLDVHGNERLGAYTRTSGRPRLLPTDEPAPAAIDWTSAKIKERQVWVRKACRHLWATEPDRRWTTDEVNERMRELLGGEVAGDLLEQSRVRMTALARDLGARQVSGPSGWTLDDLVGDVAMRAVEEQAYLTTGDITQIYRDEPWTMALSPSGLDNRGVSWAVLVSRVEQELRDGGAPDDVLRRWQLGSSRADGYEKGREHSNRPWGRLEGRLPPDMSAELNVVVIFGLQLFFDGVPNAHYGHTIDAIVPRWPRFGYAEPFKVEIKPRAMQFKQDRAKSPADFDVLVCWVDDRPATYDPADYPADVIVLSQILREEAVMWNKRLDHYQRLWERDSDDPGSVTDSD